MPALIDRVVGNSPERGYRASTKPFSLAGLCLFAAAFPILEGYSNAVNPIGSFGLGLAVIAVWLIESAVRGIRIGSHIVIILMFLVWNCLTMLWTENMALTTQRLISLTAVVCLLWAVMDSARSEKAITYVCLAYVMGVTIEAIDAAQNIRSTELYQGLSGRFSASGFDPNNFGIMAITTVPLAICISVRINCIWLGIAYSGMIATIAIATGSRGALLSLLLITAGMLGCAWRKSIKVFVSSACALGVLTGLVAFSGVIPESTLDRLHGATFGRGGMDRLELWSGSLDRATEKPILGHGAGILWDGVSQVHNTFLSALVETGVIGLVLWITLWAIMFWKFYAVYRSQSLYSWGPSLFLASLPLAVALMTLNWEVRKPAYLLLGLAAAWDANMSHASGSPGPGARNSIYRKLLGKPPSPEAHLVAENSEMQ